MPSSVFLKRFKRLARACVPLLTAALLFAGISHWQTRSMVSTGEQLPALQLQSLAGKQTHIDWQQQTTLLYAFAPWCGVCRISMPSLSLLDQQQVRVLAIAFDYDHPQQVSQFLREVNYSGDVFLGTDKLFSQLKLSAYPSYYVIDANGLIRHRDRGLSTPPGLWLRTQL